jgi:hypothetical protein
MDPDNDAQEKIDAEEAAAAEAADQEQEQPAGSEDSANEEEATSLWTEMEFLKQLEGLDRQLLAVETEKDLAVKVFNKKIKEITSARDLHLINIESWRLGARNLFE